MSLQQITTGDINTSATPTLAGLTVTSNIASSNVTVSGTHTANNLTVTGTPTFTNAISAPNTFGFKNRIINGAGVISQYNGATAVTNSGGTTYFMDRWLVYDGSGGSHFSVGQNKGGVTPPAGFTNYIGINVTSAVSASATNNFSLQQHIEGFNIADLAWGTASAKTVTLSFWIYCSLTGTFGGSLRDNGADYLYPFSFSIPVANTWTQISITITGATGGTWLTNNGRGIGVLFDLGLGSNFQSTAGAWTTNSYYTVTGATSLVGTNGANYYITGVQLETGTQATPFDYRDYGRELMMCQRYYEILWSNSINWQGNVASFYNSTRAFIRAWHKVTKRAQPTITLSNISFTAAYNNTTTTTTSSANQYPTVDSTSIEVTGSYTVGYSGHFDVNSGCLVTASAEL